MTEDAGSHDGLLRAVERLTQTFEQAGMPRMAARVFSYVLAEDSDRYTAAQLATGLRVSPAAISGAVRYLVDTRMLSKEREPGMRSDLYRIHDDDVWQRIVTGQTSALDAMSRAVTDAVTMVDPGAGSRRLLETKAFLDFMSEELPRMMQRWSERRATLFG